MTLSPSESRRLSDICADIAQVSLASIAVPFLLDSFTPSLAILGIAAAGMFWIISMRLAASTSEL